MPAARVPVDCARAETGKNRANASNTAARPYGLLDDIKYEFEVTNEPRRLGRGKPRSSSYSALWKTVKKPPVRSRRISTKDIVSHAAYRGRALAPPLDHGRPRGCPSLPFDVGPPPDSLVGAGDLAAFHQRWPSGAGGRARTRRRSLRRAGGRGRVRRGCSSRRRGSPTSPAADGCCWRRRSPCWWPLGLVGLARADGAACRSSPRWPSACTPARCWSCRSSWRHRCTTCGSRSTSPTNLAVIFPGFGDGTLPARPARID